MICPHCGDAVEDGFETCPYCGGQLYDAYPPAPSEDGFYGGSENKTAIVALDPEFNKKTQIVANPMLEDASFKKVKRRKQQSAPKETEQDDLTYLMSLFKYIYGRLNMLEKISFWMLITAVFFSFAPWIRTLKYGNLVSGFELEGLYVALLAAGSALALLTKIGLRLGLWMTMIYLALGFGSMAFMVYLMQRGALPGQEYLASFYITLGAAGGGFVFLFTGSMRRFLQ